MASIDWPTTLPQEMLVDGYNRTAANGILRSDMDAGPAKVRRRFTSAPQVIAGSIFVTAAQLALFKTFYNTTSLGGSLRFDWVDPDNGTTAVEMRFAAPPTWAPQGGSEEYWVIEMALEVLP